MIVGSPPSQEVLAKTRNHIHGWLNKKIKYWPTAGSGGVDDNDGINTITGDKIQYMKCCTTAG
jgi:hypothetical protein